MGSEFPKNGCRGTGDGSGRLISVGARILVPGLPQWSWRQTDRAFFLFGSFAAALLVGVMTWGTAAGLGMLAFAFAAHVFSAVDAIRQNAFPGFGRMVPVLTTSAGLGTVVYVPALALASVYAWPIAPDHSPRDGYLINRWSYASERPRTGETVWLRSKRWSRSNIARVVAGPGQRVEWSSPVFRVDDQPVSEHPFQTTGSPSELKLTIPEGHFLVVFPTDPRWPAGIPSGWEIVDEGEIRGRAWARAYPIWDRGLIP